MNLKLKPFKEWFDSLSAEEQINYRNDLAFLLATSRKWQEKVNSETAEELDINFNINMQVFKRALTDAYDDLKRLKDYHGTEYPNPIKEMSYFAYWIIKNKPLTLLNEEVLNNKCLSQMQTIKLLHCNESFVLPLLIHTMFPGKKLSEGESEENLKAAEKEFKIFKGYLLYYLIYRLDSPKSLEAILLSGTMKVCWEVDEVIWENVLSEVTGDA